MYKTLYLHKSLFFLVAACSSGEGGAAEPPRASPSPSPSPSPSSSGRVLTDAVLAMQRETIQCIREVAGELKAIKTVLSEMSKKMK